MGRGAGRRGERVHAATRESDDDTVGRCWALTAAGMAGTAGTAGTSGAMERQSRVIRGNQGYGRYVVCDGEVSRVEPGQQKRILGCIGLEEPAEEHLWGSGGAVVSVCMQGRDASGSRSQPRSTCGEVEAPS